jgi:DNA invertase Pin-like site-specific DNA recombinase
LRAIAYLRLDDPQGPDRAALDDAFQSYCQSNLHQPIAVFAGPGAAADGGPGDEYRAMTSYVKTSGSEFLLVVPDARHLGGDLESVVRASVELEQLGLKLVCLDEEFPDPIQNALQTLGVKGVSRTRSRRIKEAMGARALSGQALGRPPYGYRIGPTGKLKVVRGREVDEEQDEASVVELMYRLYTTDGLGLRLIVRHLNERGIVTRRGGNWNVVSVRDILKNPVYTGTYTRLGMRRSNVHEAIISRELFRKAQDQTVERRPLGRVVRSEPFLLSGAVYCGYCGNKMMGVTRRQSWKRKDGRRGAAVYRYYQCQSRNNQSVCEYHTWRAPLLESTVLGQLRVALEGQKAHSEEDAPARHEREEAVREMRRSRAKIAERRFLGAIRRAASGEMTLATLGQYLDELDAARAAAESPVLDPGTVLDTWDSLPIEQRAEFIEENVDKITVHDDTINISSGTTHT